MLTRSLTTISRVTIAEVAADARALATPAGVITVPPELRRYIAAHAQHRSETAPNRQTPLFAARGHWTPATIQQALARLDPALWRHATYNHSHRRPAGDGREYLHGLNAWELWPPDQPRHPMPNRVESGHRRVA
jgi:hypothetical protein